MKKIIAIILTGLIIGTSFFASSDKVFAKTQTEETTLSVSKVKDALFSLSHKLIGKAKTFCPFEVYSRIKKIVDFYRLANSEGFTNLYHPLPDDSINEAEILQGLPTDDSLCIILHGNALNDDGTKSEKFTARLRTALAMANKYPNAKIMMTGGHTAGLSYPSEADVGKAWLIEHGIDESRIITEDVSWDTFSNAFCSLTISELSKHKELKNFVVVTSDYHAAKCSRYWMLFIYMFGYDRPEEEGGRGYRYLGNLGAVIG